MWKKIVEFIYPKFYDEGYTCRHCGAWLPRTLYGEDAIPYIYFANDGATGALIDCRHCMDGRRLSRNIRVEQY